MNTVCRSMLFLLVLLVLPGANAERIRKPRSRVCRVPRRQARSRNPVGGRMRHAVHHRRWQAPSCSQQPSRALRLSLDLECRRGRRCREASHTTIRGSDFNLGSGYGFGRALSATFAVVAITVYGLLTRYASPETLAERETRCRKCGYILRGITEPRCPECGERI